jgi:hypothetical protein
MQTHKYRSIIYPSPIIALVGKSVVLSKLPLITIVPGLTPPIVEPVGNETDCPSALIVAPSVPKYIVDAAV